MNTLHHISTSLIQKMSQMPQTNASVFICKITMTLVDTIVLHSQEEFHVVRTSVRNVYYLNQMLDTVQ